MRLKQDAYLDNLSPLENNIAKLYRTNVIQPLKGFCRVIEEGSLSSAAEKYGVTPGLITKQIKALEYQLGVALFNRDKNCRVFPNEAGLRFYERASKMISQFENLISDFSAEENTEENRTLRIGVSSFMVTELMPLLSAFRNENSNINITIESYEYDKALGLLDKNKIDIFISSYEYAIKGISGTVEFIKIIDYSPYWVLWKGHPLENREVLTKRDLLNSKIVFDIEDITMKSFRNFIEDYKIKSAMNIKNFCLEAQKSLITSKVGISLFFDIFLNKKDAENFVFKRAINLFPGGECGVFAKKTRKTVTNKLIDFLNYNMPKSFDFEFLKNS